MSVARLITLRRGRTGRALFVFPGAGAAAQELAGLAAALPGARPVLGVEPFEADAEGRPPGSVEAMAEQAAAAIRARQPNGPYALLGYSFGGLVAVETARRLQAAGHDTAFVGLVDTVFDRRFWPLPLFLAATGRRTRQHLARIARRPLGEAVPELAARARRLLGRLAARFRAGGAGEAAASSAALRPNEALSWAAMAAHRPRLCAFPVVFFGSAEANEFGCDTADLWRPLAPELQVRRIAGSHLALAHDPASVAELAREVGAALSAAEAPQPPRVLIAASFNWIAHAQLALGLMEAGFAVQAVCRPGHCLRRLGFLERIHPLNCLDVRASLAKAVAAARPDLILAGDDRTIQALYALHEHTDPRLAPGAWLRARLVRSLGPSAAYSWLYSRTAVMVIAEEERVVRPATGRVRSAAEARSWMAEHPGRAVLKSDGSWGGREVVFVDDAEAAVRAFRRMNRPPHPLRAIKRLLVEGDAAPLRAALGRRRPTLSLQAHVAGAPANAAVACLDGRVLAAVYAEVVRSDGALGPATVVRVVENPQMARAVAAMVGRLGLSGLCGFDFILEEGTGAASLIELNPRATPTAHLIGADGGNLLAALAAALERRDVTLCARPTYAGGLVALFPQEMRRDPESAYLRSAHHDVPWHAPDLVQIALASANTPRAALNRLARRLSARP